MQLRSRYGEIHSSTTKVKFCSVNDVGMNTQPNKKFKKRYLEDQCQVSNRYNMKVLLTSFFALADSEKLLRQT
jgi:hypothetical protein